VKKAWKTYVKTTFINKKGAIISHIVDLWIHW